MKIMKPERLATHSDARGFVFEPLRPQELPRQQNTHLVISEPGVVRGNHYHLRGTETLAVMGPALVRIRAGSALSDITVPPDRVYRFVFPPKVSHAMKNLSDRANILVAFNTVAHDPERPDVEPDILIADK
jgi:UDP-2-acetamido-2,6-beta-L-arabino-hexul-4-ose reductase